MVIGRESGSGLISKGPVLTKDEFWGCEIEIAEGVMISTPSATHLVGLHCQRQVLPESGASAFLPQTHSQDSSGQVHRY